MLHTRFGSSTDVTSIRHIPPAHQSAADIYLKPTTWAQWNGTHPSASFLLSHYPNPGFVFDPRAKKELLWNAFSGTIESDAVELESFRQHIADLVYRDPELMVDQSFVQMCRKGF
jgi:hypothetical protein